MLLSERAHDSLISKAELIGFLSSSHYTIYMSHFPHTALHSVAANGKFIVAMILAANMYYVVAKVKPCWVFGDLCRDKDGHGRDMGDI